MGVKTENPKAEADSGLTMSPVTWVSEPFAASEALLLLFFLLGELCPTFAVGKVSLASSHVGLHLSFLVA